MGILTLNNLGKALKSAVSIALVATGVGLATGAVGFSFSAVGNYFARQFATSAVLGFISNALTPKKGATEVAQLSGQTVASRNPISPRKIAYGRIRTSGTIVFIEATGTDNKYMHQIVTLAGHEISSVDSVWFNDESVLNTPTEGTEYTPNTGSYSGYADITTHFGASDQLADANLVSRTSMTSDHRLRGIAYVYTRFTYNQDKYPSGIPNVSAVINGKKVYDPRSETTVYSNNAALCILDYLTDDTYGLGADSDEIDYASFITAANICDEQVDLDAGGTESRYTINGIIDTSRTPSSILQEMASSCAGTVYYSNGRWHLKAGAYITPTSTLTVDDFVGVIDITTRVTNQSNFNAVKGVFVSPDDNWQPVDFPVLTSTTFELEDGGERRYADMTLPFTTSSTTAQRLAKIALYRNREQLTVTVTCKLTAFKYDIGDTLMLTHERMGWDQKVFEVIGWQYSGGDTPSVAISLKETSGFIYDWGLPDEKALTRNNTTLPSAFDVAPVTNLSVTQLSSVKADGAFDSAINVSWTAPQTLVDRYEVQWQIEGDANWNSTYVNDTKFVIRGTVELADYVVRVRTYSFLNVRSGWTSSNLTTAVDTVAPSVPTNISVVAGYKQLTVVFDRPVEKDFLHCELYRSDTDDFNTAVNAAIVTGSAYTDTGLGVNSTWYYWLKSVDRTGNKSDESVSATGTTLFVDAEDFSESVNDLFSEASLYGIEPVENLPLEGDFLGQQVFLRSEGKLYSWSEPEDPDDDNLWVATIADVADGSITSVKIGLSTIDASNIKANTITGGLIASSGIITSSAQINNSVIDNASIQNGAITEAKIGDGEVTNAKIGNIIESANYSAGSKGWKINKDGSAEFNGVVLSRQLLVDSGQYTVGYIPDNGAGTLDLIATRMIETNIPVSSWYGTNETYLVAIGNTGTVHAPQTAVDNYPTLIQWGWAGQIVPITRWSGGARLFIKADYYTRYSSSSSNVKLQWKVYKVT